MWYTITIFASIPFVWAYMYICEIVNMRPPKVPENAVHLAFPTRKRAIGMRLSVEFTQTKQAKNNLVQRNINFVQ